MLRVRYELCEIAYRCRVYLSKGVKTSIRIVSVLYLSRFHIRNQRFPRHLQTVRLYKTAKFSQFSLDPSSGKNLRSSPFLSKSTSLQRSQDLLKYAVIAVVDVLDSKKRRNWQNASYDQAIQIYTARCRCRRKTDRVGLLPSSQTKSFLCLSSWNDARGIPVESRQADRTHIETA